MKKLLSSILLSMILYMYTGLSVMAANPNPNMPKPKQTTLQASPNAKSIELAFVFDGPSDKNAEVLATFQKGITISLLPDFKASFPKELIFTGDWTENGAKIVSDKALSSRARMIISLGYMSSDYYAKKQNKQKYVVTIDQYGLRDFGDKFFNPVQQSVNDLVTFKTLVPGSKKTAILMNENYYNMHQNWDSIIRKKLTDKNCNIDFVVIPVNSNVKNSLSKIPSDVNLVFVTPLFNLTQSQRKEVYKYINDKKLPSYSTVGKEDVALGAMLGASTFNVDKKLAEATSFNIHGVLHGMTVKEERLPFYDDKVLFYNSDTGETVGYTPSLRLLNNSMVISNKELPKYSLGTLLDALDDGNLDMKRKQFLIKAAKSSVASAYMRYLPTLRLDLGYQTYNGDYATSYADVPTRAGVFTVAMDQVLYSPDLVTNIIVKHKKLKFDKAEHDLTTTNTEFQAANLYIDALILENAIKIKADELQETRDSND
ncbi:MAG: TolC family protein [bacterium]|nr:TolC family protein [bacterium]